MQAAADFQVGFLGCSSLLLIDMSDLSCLKEPMPTTTTAAAAASPRSTAAVSFDLKHVPLGHLSSPLAGVQREVHAGVGRVEEEAGGAGAGGHQRK